MARTLKPNINLRSLRNRNKLTDQLVCVAILSRNFMGQKLRTHNLGNPEILSILYFHFCEKKCQSYKMHLGIDASLLVM